MKVVYLIRSLSAPGRTYIGLTSDMRRRLAEHNSSASPHTSKYPPWEVLVQIRFEDDCRAVAFERYLKSGSGNAFARRHFW